MAVQDIYIYKPAKQEGRKWTALMTNKEEPVGNRPNSTRSMLSVHKKTSRG